ncbi:MAG: hypothetical protein JNK82_12325 [Myxococcaceae bacterium]|nr:hypothetical protein [Myxococcaceae bacterium]
MQRPAPSIWLWALGYFACYAPYSALTKALSSQSGEQPALDGVALLPLSTLASLAGMAVFMVATGWWRAASRRTVLGVSVPCPSRWTLLSGLATAAIIGTTTLAYTFRDTSIVFMMLLMRGGVLILAPLVDALAGRHIRWSSWVALGLSIAAVAAATLRREAFWVSAAALADAAVYLASYFVRLRFMSRLAKGEPGANRRYFVEEQLVAAPAIFVTLALIALVGPAELAAPVRQGFFGLTPGQATLTLAVGLLSQGTGVFGALILLDARESSFCVPVNRASSILAGVLATVALGAFGLDARLGAGELLGAGLVLAAIGVLALPRRPPRAGSSTPGAATLRR